MAEPQIVALWSDLRQTALSHVLMPPAGQGESAALAPRARARSSQNRAQGALRCYPGRRQGDGRAGDMPGSLKREHRAERLQAIRLRYSINTHLEDRGIATPAAIGATIGLPDAGIRLLTRRQQREDNVAAPEASANRLGLYVPLEGPWPAHVRGEEPTIGPDGDLRLRDCPQRSAGSPARCSSTPGFAASLLLSAGHAGMMHGGARW
jgi:hypothetical protein